MSKLIAEVDKLLEKGKLPEAIDKLKSGIRSEPLNQLLATKLANIFLEQQEPANAAKVYVALASRLSEAGKAQVAIAIYKQALDLDPTNIELKVKFAIESESAGKISDAHHHAQIALQFYLRRKKFFDASNLFPLLVRTAPKDEKLKLAWVEVLQLSQAEQKVLHLLVALCGPPGLISPEFSVGGEPTALNEQLYQSLKNLVYFFPRDPKVAYAVAWAAYRRENEKDFFHMLRECFRRESDFCLAALLYARYLSEKQRLNESLFVFKYFKERMGSDRSTDMLTLSRLMEGFIEKNGWITFTDGMGIEELDAEMFSKKFLEAAPAGEPANSPAASSTPDAAPSGAPPEGESPTSDSDKKESVPESLELPFEIALPAGDEMELVLTSGQSQVLKAGEKTEEPKQTQSAAASATDSKQKPQVESSPKAAEKVVEAAPQEAPKSEPAPSPAPIANMNEAGTGSVVFTSIIKVESENLAKNHQQADAESVAEQEKEAPPAKKPTFNPMEDMQAPPIAAAEADVEAKTQLFTPMDLIGVASKSPAASVKAPVGTKVILTSQADLADAEKLKQAVAPPPAEPPVQPPPAPQKEFIEGESTAQFSPVEAVQAGVASRRSQPLTTAPTTPPLDAMAPEATPLVPDQTKTEAVSITQSEAATKIFEALASEGEATTFISRDMAKAASESIKENEIQQEAPPEQAEEQRTMVFSAPENEAVAEPPPAPKEETQFEFSPSAENQENHLALPEPVNEQVDLGDDLLEASTKIAVQNQLDESTKNLFAEIKKEISQAPDGASSTLDVLFKKAERYIAKRNYYLARKALRHCLALGGDEEKIKSRMADIRKLELPNSLYLAESNDARDNRSSEEILERLEAEFDLNSDSEVSVGIDLEKTLESQIEKIMEENDSRSIFDFGIALHEMGLFRQAERVFSLAVEKFPQHAFDAYYLAAVSKAARKDYAGAASILKKLSHETGKSEEEKIQIYYALGEVFEKMHRKKSSKEFYKKVADLDSNYRNIRHKLED